MQETSTYSSKSAVISFRTMRAICQWKPWTRYYKTHLIPLGETKYGDVFVHQTNHYLKRGEEVTRIPDYLWQSLKGEHVMTEATVRYKFFNGFEKSKEGRYLMSISRYESLTPVAKVKVDAILATYSEWVEDMRRR